ncbi:hypothetical protein F4677DRAFT_352774 [Hypoxylon crocopeplum]|nr:hypothetical protein F4677DRAFT_352774 [Hypoxylon crocopeplum]
MAQAAETTPGPRDVTLCHCYACRHSTGLLCVSYAPIQALPSLRGLTAFPDDKSALRRYFCGSCGCHVFRQEKPSAGDDSAWVGGSWAVATGVIIGRVGSDGEPLEAEADGEEQEPLLRCAGHANTAGTKDGGLSPFINHRVGEPGGLHEHPDDAPTSDQNGDDDVLEAQCLCKTIRFHITRPDASSRVPHSGFPDLTVPFATTPAALAANPGDEKWWLRPEGSPTPTKYLAGTCACRSCRLISGFEVQTWAFVPRFNIFFLPSPSSALPPSKSIPLDFDNLKYEGVNLQSYESSPGVLREFCPCCGATVFWHDRWRPHLVDVSVGLLDAVEGARAERWLEWWHGRVSFEEDATNGRTGGTARWARTLVSDLEEGLRGSERGEGS